MQKDYGKVFKVDKYGIVVQAYPDLPHVKEDKKVIDLSLNFIGGFEYGPNNCLKVNKDIDTEDMKFMDAVKASVQLVKLLGKEPDEKFFHLTFVVGHGMHF